MIVYTVPGCPLCRKIKAVLREKNIRYREKSLYASLLDEDELRILILWMRLKGLITDGDDPEMPVYLRENPSRIPRPLIFTEEGDPQIDFSSYDRICQSCKTSPICMEVRQKQNEDETRKREI
ncbi:MAG: hypothetical protein IIZ27_04330 [Solobacterium sp.]|nr:hypothetical protein [Solobacterium sp.]